MLNDNIKNLRKAKGYTQEELASRCNVTRQTISKWEKGYSVPEAELLKKLAEIFEVNVSQLLGGTMEQSTSTDMVAEQLARINEQLVIKNRRARRIWRTIGIVLLVLFLWQVVLLVVGVAAFSGYKVDAETYIEQVEEVEKF